LNESPQERAATRANGSPAPASGHIPRHPRIAIIGDTDLRHGELTDAGAIAIEIASGWSADIGFRSVAANRPSWELLDDRFGEVGITTWLTIRDHEDQPEDTPVSASIRMGDMLNVDELFKHDLVIVASRDRALRRFLADLPVHTYPGVRMLSLIHFRDGVIADEQLDDLTRFDVVIGSEADFAEIAPSPDDTPTATAIEAMAPVIEGTNVRAVVSWGKHGAFRCVTRDTPLQTIPPHHAPHTSSDAPWAAFVGAIAIGLTRRQAWADIGREATRRFAIRSQALRSERL
jgi:hypothetical protein